MMCTLCPLSRHSPHDVYTLPMMCTLSPWCVHSPRDVYTLPVMCALSPWCVHSPHDVYTLPVMYTLSPWCVHYVVYWYYKNLWFHLRNIDSNSGNKIRKSQLVFNPLQTIYFPLPQTVSSPRDLQHRVPYVYVWMRDEWRTRSGPKSKQHGSRTAPISPPWPAPAILYLLPLPP